MLAWIENNLVGQPTATRRRLIAVSATHTPATWTAQVAAFIIVGAALISAIMETWLS